MAKKDKKELEVKATLHAENHHAARPMKVIVDDQGCPWLCDASANPKGDLAAQGCWRCSEVAFTRND
ncbi:MAG: hypothetical protein JHC34_07065 [Acidobacteria bacterium]|nr:hypothetical protein [Acidobacteriota bacterium]